MCPSLDQSPHLTSQPGSHPHFCWGGGHCDWQPHQTSWSQGRDKSSKEKLCALNRIQTCKSNRCPQHRPCLNYSVLSLRPSTQKKLSFTYWMNNYWWHFTLSKHFHRHYFIVNSNSRLNNLLKVTQLISDRAEFITAPPGFQSSSLRKSSSFLLSCCQDWCQSGRKEERDILVIFLVLLRRLDRVLSLEGHDGGRWQVGCLFQTNYRCM